MAAPRESVLGATPFELTGPLPAGPTTTVLEASAGTGKTFAIVGLMVRYIAEGTARLSDLLLVTFSRAASRELRERARARLVSAERALRDPRAAREGDDLLTRFLASAPDAVVAERHARLAAACADFDSATVTTTHAFCQQMLEALGLSGDLEPGAVFVEDIGDLVTEAAEDLYLRGYAGRPTPPFSIADARTYARLTVANPRALLSPAADPPESPSGERVAYAAAVRAEVDRRKRRARLRDFDDLQGLLGDALADPVHGERARQRLRRLFSVVLVDEFQDTDPVQWEIFRSAFHGHATLVLVGDPKQSIYAFRGAEVLSYLAAAADADRHQALATNWRTDAGLVKALHRLYGDAALGDDQIVVHDVAASHGESRMPGSPPLRIRYLGRNGLGPTSRSGYPYLPPIRAAIARDVAADIVTVLNRGTPLVVDGVARPLEPGDVAVLARSNLQVADLKAQLEAVGVPAVVAGGTSVFATPAAQDWLWLLQALESPNRGDRARLAALTPLLGYTATQIAEQGDALVSEISGRLRALARVFETAGFAAMFASLARESELEGRLLARTGGERAITDLRHIAELLQRATVSDGLGLTALTRWLTDHIADPAVSTGSDRSRRLETDAAAVQVMTVHGSKGLEFPVVYLPYAWDAARSPHPATLTLHDAARCRILDVGTEDSPGYADRKSRALAEESGEELRLLYVGATRAQCQVVLWWAPSTATGGSALNRLLFGREGGGRVPAERATVPPDDAVPDALARWAAPVAASVSIEPADHTPGETWIPPDADRFELELPVARRRVDHAWRRTSYTALVSGAAHGPGATASEPDLEGRVGQPDEPDGDPLAEPAAARDAPPSLMNGLSGGAAFGTLVHEILEHVDTAAADLDAEVLANCRAAAAFGGSSDDPEHLARALGAVLRTPLGTGELAHLTLAEIGPRDHLAELDFELPLGPADTGVAADGAATLGVVADLLAAYLPPSDPLAGYAARLRTVPAAALRGFLTGSIDSVLRVRTGADERYVVVDYKTNRLARGDLTTADYTAEKMATEMLDSHYVLQALLYSVALHRFLRWRRPGYRPKQHLGPVQYHFVRGMIGPETPPGCGVFEWHPPAALITAVSDALAGVRR
ncbi:exodeoxyribonuclease V subunit beta [Tsukamurella soli]|uniref:RecBCD enzyme subunit RecB n=1 Tax=Tsukamurella soli TaxID=644556 RepID=A0ABP8KH60_9ACTN